MIPRAKLERLHVEAGQAGDEGMLELTRRAMRGDLEALGQVLGACPGCSASVCSWRCGAVVEAIGEAIKASAAAGGTPATLWVRPGEYPAAKAQLHEAAEIADGPMFLGVRDTGDGDHLWAVRLIGDDRVIPAASR